MTAGIRIRHFLPVLIILISTGVMAQTVPVGIHYQAVARDDYGKELCEKEIDVLFSIISESPLGPVEYKELHARIRTSKYGVFSLVVGLGEPVGGTAAGFSQIAWEESNHYLKVEVKFNNDFIDMGTMQFLAVPYALYARKSLEPGPQGTKGDPGPQGLKGDQGAKGDPGNPATDDQSLSFNGNNLTISGGNTVNLGSLNQYLSLKGDTLGISNGNFVMLTNQIQDLQLDINNRLKITKNATASEIDLNPLKQDLSFNSTTGFLSISNGTGVDLTPIKNDAIQDLQLDTDNKLTVTKNPAATEIDLSIFKQNLSYNNTTGMLSISNGTGTDLSVLKTDEIQNLHLDGNQLTIDKTSSPGVDLSKYLDDKDEQTLTYNPSNYTLSISKSGSSVPIGSLIAFRATKTVATSAPTPLSNVDFIPDTPDYNDGGGLNLGTGEFTAQYTGIYTFDIKYIAPSSGDGRMIMIYKNGNLYENLGSGISSGTTLFRSLTIKLVTTDKIKFVIHTGTGTDIGTGSFSGFRVY